MSDDSRRPGDDDSNDLGEGWLTGNESRPADQPITDAELGAFLRGSIPTPAQDYWAKVEAGLDDATDAPGVPSLVPEVDDELSGFLLRSIPAPTAGYWSSIDARLSEIERNRGELTVAVGDHSPSADTAGAVVRPMTMQTKTPSRRFNPLALAAAAALIVLAGFGLVAALNRGGSEDPVDLATQPDAPAQVEVPAAAQGTGDPSQPQPAAPAGPLTTMQLQLIEPAPGVESTFCFASPDVAVAPVTDPVTGLSVVLLSIQPNGSLSFMALQNDTFLLWGADAGNADGRFVSRPTGIANLGGSLPPVDVTITDTSFALGAESVLPLVDCGTVEAQIATMQTLNQQFEEAGGAEALLANEGPLFAMQAALMNLLPNATPYCFAGEGTQIIPAAGLPAERSAVEFNVQPGGSFTLTGVQNQGAYIIGDGVGDAEGRLIAGLTGFGDVAQAQPAAEITIGNDTITFGNDTLNRVPCEEIAGRIAPAAAALANADLDPFNGAGGPAVPAPITEIDPDQVLSSAGLGPIRIGMRVSELEAELGVDLGIVTIGPDAPGDCGMIEQNIANGMFLLVESDGAGDGIVRRVSVDRSDWATPSGIRIGSTEQQVLDAFPGQIVIKEHVFAEDGAYLEFLPSDPTDPNTVEFVVESGIVVEIRAGASAGGWVSFAEGCA